MVLVGTPVTYTYLVYNRGNTVLEITSLVDDKCDSPTYVSGDLRISTTCST